MLRHHWLSLLSTLKKVVNQFRSPNIDTFSENIVNSHFRGVYICNIQISGQNQSYESRLNNIEIEDKAYRISFSCCDLALSLNKVGLEEPAEEEENLRKSNFEFERVLVINDDENPDEKFDNFFINIDNKVLLLIGLLTQLKQFLKTPVKIRKIKYPKTLICEFCGEPFIGKDRVYNFFHHRNKSHIQEVKYTCPICNKVYWGERQLCAHISSHAAKDFMCEVCGTAFQRKNDFHRHKLIHNEKKFNCKYCSKLFTRNDNLKIHERIHTGDCIHLCTKCNNGFPQKNQLKLHMKKCKTFALIFKSTEYESAVVFQDRTLFTLLESYLKAKS
ncbi:Zinc finger protein [Armadillidium nasatum]|uniref:Zinc finger protein n=1 Tax=Armadillidium nasatum TaxID=96803 RepID=A0A5N5SJB7_9CRUS|nr:Zinc finger protein [Armadillidium nasatum]